MAVSPGTTSAISCATVSSPGRPPEAGASAPRLAGRLRAEFAHAERQAGESCSWAACDSSSLVRAPRPSPSASPRAGSAVSGTGRFREFTLSLGSDEVEHLLGDPYDADVSLAPPVRFGPRQTGAHGGGAGTPGGHRGSRPDADRSSCSSRPLSTSLPDFDHPDPQEFPDYRPSALTDALVCGPAAQGLHFLDLFRCSGKRPPLYFRADEHWNAVGQRLAADQVAALIRARGLLSLRSAVEQEGRALASKCGDRLGLRGQDLGRRAARVERGRRPLDPTRASRVAPGRSTRSVVRPEGRRRATPMRRVGSAGATHADARTPTSDALVLRPGRRVTRPRHERGGLRLETETVGLWCRGRPGGASPRARGLRKAGTACSVPAFRQVRGLEQAGGGIHQGRLGLRRLGEGGTPRQAGVTPRHVAAPALERDDLGARAFPTDRDHARRSSPSPRA